MLKGLAAARFPFSSANFVTASFNSTKHTFNVAHCAHVTGEWQNLNFKNQPEYIAAQLELEPLDLGALALTLLAATCMTSSLSACPFRAFLFSAAVFAWWLVSFAVALGDVRFKGCADILFHSGHFLPGLPAYLVAAASVTTSLEIRKKNLHQWHSEVQTRVCWVPA